MEGIVLSRYSSFYYVKAENKIWECRLRGKQRLTNTDVIAGDKVIFSKTGDGQGIIEKILPRDTELYRPAIANATQLMVVMSLKAPPVNWELLDRLLVLGAYFNLKPCIVFNKLDIADEGTIIMANEYGRIGYTVIFTSVEENTGFEDLKETLKDEITVLAGLSGVGKSSLINAIEVDISLQIGPLSNKAERGKHTTRFVQLLPLSFGGLVADTPGFSRIYLPPELKREDLRFLFPEIEELQGACRFSSCLHDKEPGCKVRDGLETGLIAEWRYKNYLEFLKKVIEEERSF